MYLLETLDIRIADEGWVAVVGISIGTDEYAPQRAMEVVKDAGADRLTRCLVSRPVTQAAAVIAIKSLGQITIIGRWVLNTGPSR